MKREREFAESMLQSARESMRFYDMQGEPISREQWSAMFEKTEERIIGKTPVGDQEVSTVWLGIDHGYDGLHPLIFETLVFGGDNDQYLERYPSLEAALIGHARIVAALKRGENLTSLGPESMYEEMDGV